MTDAHSTEIALAEIEQFLYREARLADEHAYAEWEGLWTDDAHYWVPAAADRDPASTMSVINDNRRRIATRIQQLETGRRYAQSPPSRLARTISNVELIGVGDDPAGDLLVGASFLLVEATERGRHVWAGRLRLQLRPTDDGLRLARKTVDLVDRPWHLPTLAFLI